MHDAGGDEGAVLAQAVAHDHVRVDAVLGQQLINGGVHRQHGRLGDGRLHQIEFGLFHGRRVVAVHEDVAGERAAEDGRHHPVGVGEQALDHRLAGGQVAAHVGILAALAGEEEGDLTWRLAAAAEDALRHQRFPGGGIVEAEGLTRLLDAIQQLVVVAEIDYQAFGRRKVGGIRRGDGRRPPILHLAEGLVEAILQCHRRRRPQGQNAPQRRFRDRWRRCDGDLVHLSTCFLVYSGRRKHPLPIGLQHPRHMLLQHDMEVGAAEPIGADAGAAGKAIWLGPFAQLVVDEEGRLGEIDVGVGFLGV